MRIKTRTAVCSLALSLVLVLPSVALGQQRAVGELVTEINAALAANPTPSGSYQLSIDSFGRLVAEKNDATGVLARWEIYFEDIGSVVQTTSGQVYLNCADEVGRCARQTCNGLYQNFTGCVRADGSALRTRHSDALELEYGYDTRAMRALATAFEELLSHDLGG